MPKELGISEPSSDKGTFEPLREGVFEWHPEMRLIRFMFSDGDTLDILTPRDDSYMRGALLKHAKKDAIVGSTILGVSDA